MRKNILLWILIALLVVGNIFFFCRARESEFVLQIGVPSAGQDETTGVNFTHSQRLTEKAVVKDVLLALRHSEAVETAQELPLPDAQLQIMEAHGNTQYDSISIWLEEDSVLYRIQEGEWSEFRRIQTPYYVESFREIVEKQIAPYGKLSLIHI